MKITALALLVTLLAPDRTNQTVEIADSMLYPGYTGIVVQSGYNLELAIQESISNSPSFSCVTDYGNQATLVASNIAVACAHRSYRVGNSISFGGITSVVEYITWQPTWSNEVTTGQNGYMIEDYTYLHLSKSYPQKVAKLAPENWFDYFELDDYFYYGPLMPYHYIPAILVNRSGGVRYTYLVYDHATERNLLGIGDSGSPVFLLWNDDLIFVGTAVSSAGQFIYPVEDPEGVTLERGW